MGKWSPLLGAESSVIPAKAGIQLEIRPRNRLLDPRLHGDDRNNTMKIYFQAIRQILASTTSILLVVIFILVGITLVTSKTSLYGLQSFVVASGSMEPFLPTGSIIYSLNSGDYKKGDVISFKDGNRTITHRVADVKTNAGNISYVTKGDANKTVDPTPVLKNQILGKEVLHAYHIGKLVYFTKTVPGFLTLILLPAIIFILAEFWNIKKEFEKEVRKKVLNEIGQNIQLPSHI